MSIEKTLEERGTRYGSFQDHARICYALKDTMVVESIGKFKALPADMRQALDVIADKIARILSGDPYYIDNWHDIQGYAKLIENRLQKDMDKPCPPKDANAEPAKRNLAIDALKEDATGKPIKPTNPAQEDSYFRITPTVGRKVYFYENGEQLEPWDATIISVKPTKFDYALVLFIIRPDGTTKTQMVPGMWYPDMWRLDNEPYATWMPYQINEELKKRNSKK